MGSIYYADMLDVLRAAGCQVRENSTTEGWERRARSSGGFSAAPLAVQWHHTASNTSPENDLNYMINGSSDRPVGNVLLDRTGTFWPIAAGAANTAGKGGPMGMSRGTIAKDSGNTQSFAIEAANNGVGEAWPQAQIDAYFLGSNALNVRFGNHPTDLFTHQSYAPDRKIDPATAAAVQGAWQPRSVTSSGTWDVHDVRNECNNRAGQAPTPPEPPEEEDDMTTFIARNRDTGAIALVSHSGAGVGFTWIATGDDAAALRGLGIEQAEITNQQFDLFAGGVNKPVDIIGDSLGPS